MLDFDPCLTTFTTAGRRTIRERKVDDSDYRGSQPNHTILYLIIEVAFLDPLSVKEKALEGQELRL